MSKKEGKDISLVEAAEKLLRENWQAISAKGADNELSDVVGIDLAQDIRAAVNSPTKSYRYVLPAQLVSKLANSALDCRCLQASRGGKGAFDARTVAHAVVVPFDQANENVLGGSPEPYVNNPLRVAEVTESQQAAQKNKADWGTLCRVLSQVQQKNDPGFTTKVFLQTLTEIYRRLSGTRVVYPAPIRASLEAVTERLSQFISVASGGDRLLAATAALFAVLGKEFGMYSQVRRSTITAADAATGMLADLECLTKDGRIGLVVEVKDKILTVEQLRTKMREIRERQIAEVFFVAQHGVAEEDRLEIKNELAREFAGGHNVYITDLLTLAQTGLSLLGEEGRRVFLREVGCQLDEYRSDVVHRRGWADLLSSI